ncbi:MAG: hypothetical protein IKP88_15680 [Lachnospiraceae bacterium]|nr:hypothetical protein [Lachnospiraceae bacterium]
MKKRIYMLLSAVILSVMAGCNADPGTSDRVSNQTSQVDKVIQQQVEKTEVQKQDEIEEKPVTPTEITDQITSTPIPTTDVPEKITEVPEQITDPQGKQTSENIPEYKNVDIDLTELSSTMVYSEVYNMMSMPENYIGKTIRMEGDYYTYYDEKQNQYYFACLIRDATACCAQGIEFVLAGDYTYPDDYPEEGSFVCVSGVFDTYVDEPFTYCTLRNAIFENT